MDIIPPDAEPTPRGHLVVILAPEFENRLSEFLALAHRLLKGDPRFR